jgi:hypothetical protein
MNLSETSRLHRDSHRIPVETFPAHYRLARARGLEVVVGRGLYLLQLLGLLLPLRRKQALPWLRLGRCQHCRGSVGIRRVIELVAAFVEYS